MTGAELKSMEKSHIGQIVEIEKRLFSTPWSQWMFEQELVSSAEGPGSYAVVVELNHRVVGYAIAWFVDAGVHLMNIAVGEEFQRRGIGAQLMRHLIETALSVGKIVIMLEVRAGNVGARSFYRKFMFVELGTRRAYYADNSEDAVLMALDLTSLTREGEIGAIYPESS